MRVPNEPDMLHSECFPRDVSLIAIDYLLNSQVVLFSEGLKRGRRKERKIKKKEKDERQGK